MKGMGHAMFAVAIDGPAGAGKSTIARAVAKKLKLIYVDTGALYRTIGHHVILNGGDTENADDVIASLSSARLSLSYDELGVQQIYLNGSNVSEKIRTEQMSRAASHVSGIPQVREFLLDLQRDIAANNDVVMDGRDIATVILPNADVKIFLTASVEKRAQRRYEEQISKGADVTLEAVKKDIIERDYKDSHRQAAPLKPSEQSIIVDNTDYDFDQSVEKIIEIIEGHRR